MYNSVNFKIIICNLSSEPEEGMLRIFDEALKIVDIFIFLDIKTNRSLFYQYLPKTSIKKVLSLN